MDPDPQPLRRAIQRSAFMSAYVECALWSSTDLSDEQGGAPLDQDYDLFSFAPEALREIIEDCEGFQAANGDDLEALDDAQAGHDLWLTRNRHGAGFWARGLGKRGDRLSAAAEAFGTRDIYTDGAELYFA